MCLSPHEKHCDHCCRSIFTRCIAPRLRGCSCQLEADQINRGIYDSESAENRITILIDGGECTGIQSSPALSDYFKCSAEVVSSMGAVCIINQALALIRYTFKWVKVSLFTSFGFSFQTVGDLKADPGNPLCSTVQVAYLQTDIHEAKELSGTLYQSFYTVTSTGWEYLAISVSCVLSRSETKGLVLMRSLSFIFTPYPTSSCLFTQTHKLYCYTVLLSAHTHTHSLPLPGSHTSCS